MTVSAESTLAIDSYLARNVHVLPQTNQLRALHTVIRDRTAARDDFVAASKRIIRLLVEAGLDLLPFERWEVQTPVGHTYHGLRLTEPICGVSIARAGESMEAVLRDVCGQIRIGKILIQRDKTTKLPHWYYTALPGDIAQGHVLLLDPMLATGGTARSAIEVLLGSGVREDRILFINLITVPAGIAAVCERHPQLRIVTSAIDERLNENAYMLPGIGDFGDRYFGTDA